MGKIEANADRGCTAISEHDSSRSRTSRCHSSPFWACSHARHSQRSSDRSSHSAEPFFFLFFSGSLARSLLRACDLGDFAAAAAEAWPHPLSPFVREEQSDGAESKPAKRG